MVMMTSVMAQVMVLEAMDLPAVVHMVLVLDMVLVVVVSIMDTQEGMEVDSMEPVTRFRKKGK